MPELTINAALQAAVKALSAVSDSPQLDAYLLLGHVLQADRAALLAYPGRVLTQDQTVQFDALLEQRAAGIPLPYLVGARAFYYHDFTVTPDVLIPRPETELLVDRALAWAKNLREDGRGLVIVDVGTGSGAIALSVAAQLPQAAVHAIDISAGALAVARQNAERLGIGNVSFHRGDLLAALPEALRPDLILANLPYIATGDLEALPVARHEPILALDGGPDGLDLIRRLLEQIPGYVGEHFGLLLEIGADQGQAVYRLCGRQFLTANIRVVQDYAGHDRIVEVTR